MYLFTHYQLLITFLLTGLYSSCFLVSTHSSSILEKGKEILTKECANMCIPPVWDEDNPIFIKQPVIKYRRIHEIVMTLLLAFTFYLIYDCMEKYWTFFIKLNKKGITLHNGWMIPWRDLEFTTHQNIKEKEVITAQSTRKSYYLVLKRKGSMQEIKLEKIIDHVVSHEEIVSFLRSIQAYQEAYGENGSGILNRSKIKGTFDIATNTLTIKCYDSSSTNLCFWLGVPFAAMFAIALCYDYDKYLHPLRYKLCSVDWEEGITDHRKEKRYSWEKITGPIIELYFLQKKRNGFVVSEKPFFKYGFAVDGEFNCIFEPSDMPSENIFYNIICIYNGEDPSLNKWRYDALKRDLLTRYYTRRRI